MLSVLAAGDEIPRPDAADSDQLRPGRPGRFPRTPRRRGRDDGRGAGSPTWR